MGSPFTNQTHDINPGISDNGLFWTVSIPSGSVEVNPGAGIASLKLVGLDIEDYHNVVNALNDGPSDPASLSVDLEWSGAQARGQIRNTVIGFALDFVTTGASMRWDFSVTHAGVTRSFASMGPSTAVQSPAAPLIGQGRNGKFFP